MPSSRISKTRNTSTTDQQESEAPAETTDLEDAVSDADETLADIDSVLASEAQLNYTFESYCGC